MIKICIISVLKLPCFENFIIEVDYYLLGTIGEAKKCRHTFVFFAQKPVAPLAWVPWVPGNPSVFEQWVPEPITFETKK